MSDADIRHEAKARIKRRAGIVSYSVSWGFVTVFTILIWATTGMGYFWPIWPIVGMAIGFVFMAISGALKTGGITDAQIDAEVAKMKKSS